MRLYASLIILVLGAIIGLYATHQLNQTAQVSSLTTEDINRANFGAKYLGEVGYNDHFTR